MAFLDDLKDFIKGLEGRQFIAKAYADPNSNENRTATGDYAPSKGGSWYAIGFGHNLQGTNREGKNGYVIQLGNGVPSITVRGDYGKDTVITPQQGEQLYTNDIGRFLGDTTRRWFDINEYRANKPWEALPPYVQIPLVSYAYNTGIGGLGSLISRADFKEAILSDNYRKAGEILRDYGIRTERGGGVNAGLVRRRLVEGAKLAGNIPPNNFISDSSIVNFAAADTDYFQKTYIQPLQAGTGFVPLIEAMQKKELKAQPGVVPKPGVLISGPPQPRSGPAPIQQILDESGLTVDSQLNGELSLLRGIGEVNIAFSNQTKSIVSKVDGFIPAEGAYLIQFDLFELQPDLMRQLMSANAGDSNNNVDYTHAWRAPGKLAITADITIPGASGFSIGQIFWVGRTYEHYKKFGAFQLFGLTENIELNRGWTTTIHSRFNAMPTNKILNLQSE